VAFGNILKDMRAIVQRVHQARVLVEEEVVGEIGRGLLVFLGVHRSDTATQAEWLARKVLQLRIFSDTEEKMNLSVTDAQGEILVVSQFTLYGDTRRGNRPSFTEAAAPERAKELYDYFAEVCRKSSLNVETGRFQSHMRVELSNDGPVTLLCETES
jgi:D-tyrosyl-tRNA(Tyr) deacylase